MLIVFSYGLFISCITCDFIISLYCISFTGRVFFYSFIVSSFIVYCVLCMRVCVCVCGLLPDSNKDLIWLAIWGNGIRWNETKHVELEQFWHAFTSRGFDSISRAFLFWDTIEWYHNNVTITNTKLTIGLYVAYGEGGYITTSAICTDPLTALKLVRFGWM